MFQPTSSEQRFRLRVQPTTLERALDWASRWVPAPLTWSSSCCGMALAHEGDLFEALGAAPSAVSARSADLLIVSGSISPRQVPQIESAYERLLEPKWVVAWGGCAISGGAYTNYATVSGVGRFLPVDVEVPGCPPAPEDFRIALESLRRMDLRERDVSLID